MSVQYISDSQGKHTAVVISIEDWNALKAKYRDLEILEKPAGSSIKRKPSDFAGCLSRETATKMLLDIEQSRNQWERDI
nr:hypothetical protein [uncultured Arsenicibacter sp.]